jgi:hypothetical protein
MVYIQFEPDQILVTPMDPRHRRSTPTPTKQRGGAKPHAAARPGEPYRANALVRDPQLRKSQHKVEAKANQKEYFSPVMA